MGGEGFAEEVDGGHLPAKEPVIVQFGRGPDVAFIVGIAGGYGPGHFGGAGQLAVDEALDLALGPPIVDVDHGQHVPASRLELVLDAVLEPFAAHFGRGEDQTAAHKVSRIAQTFARSEAVEVGLLAFDVHGVDRVQSEPRRERESVLLRPFR